MEDNLLSKLKGTEEPVLSFAVYFYDALKKELEKVKGQSLGRTILIPYVRDRFIKEKGQEAYKETYHDILGYFDKAFKSLVEKKLINEQATPSGKRYMLNPNK